ncbi:hypothetical protein GALMADRAFT_64396 [Galerina marginata CBS 339.88]|uniref:F-box domain-containing protein n=1 Tax=Galerina marginata (strain CBS 339.88) TaxID=685588 RepID=A0A067THM9_GALM3|nr:hypothetical protein GALMADRAFT_64396 [Galerina marginata CBS 339.88]
MSNLQINGDVYSHLFSYVSSPADLLAVSLASKEISSLAKPELVYRSIRCRLDNNAVWEHLIANPAHASRVRELEIQRENPSGYGPLDERERFAGKYSTFQESEDTIDRKPVTRQQVEASERLLIQALYAMINLENFNWDRWVPVINVGHEVLGAENDNTKDADTVPETYQEDIWTALRDYTQIRRLTVVDLGAQEAVFPNAHKIFDSAMFTLGNLTHVDLKVYYHPSDDEVQVGNVVGNADDDDVEDRDLLPGRVDISRLQTFLLRCPDIQSLTLAIFDRLFFDFGGNPYTDLSPIFSSAHWPSLSHLSLSDIIVDAGVMTTFLNNHPSIRSLAGHLSISDDKLPDIPFSLDIPGISHDAFANLETLRFPPALARQFLQVVKRSSSIREIGTLEPCDWDAVEEEEDEYNPAFDAVWGVPTSEPSQDSDDVGENRHGNLLEGLTNLWSLTVRNVHSLAQFEKLAKSTPKLEVLKFEGHCLTTLYKMKTPHHEMLPYLSQWPRLTAFRAFNLWPSNASELPPEAISAIVEDITSACPSLTEVSWIDGSAARLVKDENGSAILEFPSRKHTVKGKEI